MLPAGAVVAGLALLGASVPASAQALTWSVVPSPSPGTSTFLYGVSCAPAGTCTAVGTKSIGVGFVPRTLIESWNGTSWSVVPSPSPGSGDGFGGVSCVSAAACTAVGFYSVGNDHKTLIESWNGTSWSVVPSPNLLHNDHLYGVSCASAAGCTAVGYYYDPSRTLIESGTASG
jgi:hypothetical protein